MKQLHNADDMLEQMCAGVILCDFSLQTQSSTVVFTNRGWTDITGYTLEQLVQEKGGNPQALILPEDKPQTDMEYAAQMRIGNQYELMYRMIHRSGQVRWIIDKGSITPQPDGTLRNLSVVTEVTRLKEQEEALRLLAQQDQLTELNNKITFTSLAQTALKRQPTRLHALLVLDIDGFKDVNDRYGHAVGDRVLETVALRLKEKFRTLDVLGRVGGDEFAVLMTDLSSRRNALKKAEDLCAAIRQKSPTEPAVTVSIGIAFSTPDQDFDALFNESDAALYRAKKHGKNQCET